MGKIQPIKSRLVITCGLNHYWRPMSKVCRFFNRDHKRTCWALKNTVWQIQSIVCLVKRYDRTIVCKKILIAKCKIYWSCKFFATEYLNIIYRVGCSLNISEYIGPGIVIVTDGTEKMTSLPSRNLNSRR